MSLDYHFKSWLFLTSIIGYQTSKTCHVTPLKLETFCFSGMGSLQQNLSRGSSLVQLPSRVSQTNSAVGGAGVGSIGGGAGGLMGFNSTVGGGRVTPTSSTSSFSSGLGNFSSGGFGGQLSRQLGILPSNSMPSSSAVSGRSPLFGRDRGKM